MYLSQHILPFGEPYLKYGLGFRVLVLPVPYLHCRLASERALETAAVKGPGSLRVGLLDQLHLMSEADVVQVRCRALHVQGGAERQQTASKES